MERKDRAAIALDVHGETTGSGDNQDDRENLVDLLTDLRHWARSAGIDFDKAVLMANMHFEAES